MILLEALIFGVTFVVIKEGLTTLNVFNFLSWRFIIGALVLILIYPKKFFSLNADAIKYGALVGVSLSGGHIFQTLGINHSTASKAAFITNLCVVMVPVFLAIASRKLPSKRLTWAVMIATVGLGLLTIKLPLSFDIGDLYLFICAISYAIYVILVGKYSARFDPIQFTIVQLLTTGLIASNISFAINEFVIPSTFNSWKAIIFCAIFATAVCHAIQNKFQPEISETKAAIIFAFIPLFASIAAYFYLGEQVTFKTILGGAFILAGMLLAELKSPQANKLISDESITRN